MKQEKYLGRGVKEKIDFKKEGTFESLYAAQRWCTENGYSYGSLSRDQPVAIQKGDYDLPQKWPNMSAEGRKHADGVMVSTDFREGPVTIYVFN